MEEALKSLNIAAKIANHSNAMWDILLVMKEAAKELAGSIITTKFVWMQMKHMGTRKTKVMLHQILMAISEYHLGISFPNLDLLGMSFQ